MAYRYTPGEDAFFATDSPVGSYSAVFEDDATVAYFYAVLRREPENQILDAIHIYNSEAVLDRDRESELEMEWSEDGQTVKLFLNGYSHAIFDFARRMGRHRANFPKSHGEEWITHEWDAPRNTD
jgi:hypothetical protein